MIKRILSTLLLLSFLSACAPTPPTVATIQPATPIPKPESTNWWSDAVFYEIFVRSFYDTNNDGIGDFNGITQKLDYLQSLGITAIWLMPIFPSPSYHGYDVLNFYNVNPQYGTLDDFKNLLNEVHKRNIHVIIDLVLNHTSSQHPFFVDALRGPASKYYDWYIWSDTSKGNYWHPVMGTSSKYYFGIFCDCMPDLNYNNPEVTAQMENVTRFWLKDVGVDGFRIDAAKHLIEAGDKIENTPATHEWYKGFYTFYKADNPKAYTVGEVYGAGSSLIKSYTGNQLDQVFNFELASGIMNSVNSGSNAGINSAVKFALMDMPDFNFATFLTNHDQDRVMSDFYGDVNKAKLAAFLMFTSPGTPFIYYGEEIGMSGQKPDEDIRLPMQWSADANAGFSTATPWRAPNADYTSVNVAVQTGDANSLLEHYRILIGLRKSHPALQTGKVILLDAKNSAIYAALRTDGNETFLILANLKGESVSDYNIPLDSAGLTGSTYSVETVFGEGQAQSLKRSGGAATEYKPFESLNPYAMYILKLIPQ